MKSLLDNDVVGMSRGGVWIQSSWIQNSRRSRRHDSHQAIGEKALRYEGCEPGPGRRKQVKIPHEGQVHPEYAMYLSTRDMARLGLLMLKNGNWNGKQLIPAEWPGVITGVWTPFEEMNPPYLRALGAPERWGFGLTWWVWDAHSYPGDRYFLPFQGAYEARGTAGQYITVLPANDMVLVHKVYIDVYPQPAINQEEWDTITNMAISAACSGACK